MDLKVRRRTGNSTRPFIVSIPVRYGLRPDFYRELATELIAQWAKEDAAKSALLKGAVIAEGLSRDAGEMFLCVMGSINRDNTPTLMADSDSRVVEVLRGLASELAGGLPGDVGNPNQAYPRMVRIQYRDTDEHLEQTMSKEAVES